GDDLDRRTFLAGAAAGAVTLAMPRWAGAGGESFAAASDGSAASGGAVSDGAFAPALSGLGDDLSAIRAGAGKRHGETVQRLQTWIKQPSIAAENRGMNEGCELTMQMLHEAGFQQVKKSPTDGQPGIFATLDAGAPKTLGIYLMYDVKQVDPSEWSSPPF